MSGDIQLKSGLPHGSTTALGGVGDAAKVVVIGSGASNLQTGTLVSSAPVVVDVSDSRWPITLTLRSAAAGRKIELSTDGGIEYFTPTYDVSTATMINVGVTAPISHVRFTGVAADVWSVR